MKKYYSISVIVRLIAIFGCILSATSLSGQDLTVKAYVNHTEIGLNQQFTLTVEVSGESANKTGNPQLPSLDAFATYLGSGASQNIQFVNGKMSVSKILSYHYQAKTEGTYTIGPVTLLHQGKSYKTEPVRIQIRKVQGGRPTTSRQSDSVAAEGLDELFVEAKVDRKTVYVNEPVTVTYKIYTRVNVRSYGITKEPTMTGFWKEEFDLPQQPPTSQEVIDGKQYTVATVKKYALFPTNAGEKTLDPLVLQCGVQTRTRSRSMFDDFFDDPFFGGRTQNVTVPSNEIKITVLPMPEDGKPGAFNGAVGQYQLSARVDKNNVKTNEAITYKVKVSGNGNIRTLPDPVVQFSTDFEQYPPKTSVSVNRKGPKISGFKTYEYVLVPRIPGTHKIDAVTLTCFDPAAKQYNILTAPEQIVTVEKGDEIFSLVTPGLTKQEVRMIGQDIRFIKTKAGAFRSTHYAVYRTRWFRTLFVLPLLTLVGAFVYRNHARRLSGDVAYARERRAKRAAAGRMREARGLIRHDNQKAFYAENEKALRGYLSDKLNIAEAGMMTDQVTSLLVERKVSATLIEETFGILKTCEFQRFSPSEAKTDAMTSLAKKTEDVMVRLDREMRK